MGLSPVDVAKIVQLMIRDRTARRPRQRVPEPMVLDTDAEVAEFEEGSAGSNGLAAMYAVSSRSISRLLPPGGTVLDLGCGSGRFLVQLAEQRPDCHGFGLDLSDGMLELAVEHAAERGVDDRVSFARGDVTDLAVDVLPERIDVVACLNLLHQLPDVEVLDRCLQQIAELRDRYEAAVYLLDLRPYNRPETFPELLAIAEPDLSDDARRQAAESEAAAFAPEVIVERLHAAGLGDMHSGGDDLVRMSQVHWARSPRDPAAAADLFDPAEVTGDARMLALAYRGLP